jgi:ABC-type sugar transport system substrate-binding protein
MMCIALIGGMARLERHYQSEAKKFGIKLRIFNTEQANMAGKFAKVDAVVIFTNKVSHQARNRAMSAAQKNGIPVLMHHSCGLCTLRDCFNCLGKP